MLFLFFVVNDKKWIQISFVRGQILMNVGGIKMWNVSANKSLN
jgi:hypothetical protein